MTFLFRGESLPHANRGRLLFDTQPTFRRALEQCHELLRSRVSRSLLVELYGDSKTPSPLSEPALFALEYAMARLWQSWGIEPMAVAGHRVGQFAAACIAGVLSVADALRLTVDGVDQADGVQFSQPQVRFLGLRAEHWVEETEVATAGYWRLRARSAAGACRQTLPTLDVPTDSLVLEMALRPQIHTSALGDAALPELQTAQDNWHQMLQALAHLYIHGVKVDWVRFDREYPRRRVPLPTYPFQPARHWIDARSSDSHGSELTLRQTSHPYLGQRLMSPLPMVQFLARFSLRRLPLVKDHVLRGMPWVNLVIYLEMVLAAVAEVFGPGEHSLADVTVPHGLVLRDQDECDVQCVLIPQEDGNASFQIFSLKGRRAGGSSDTGTTGYSMPPGEFWLPRTPMPDFRGPYQCRRAFAPTPQSRYPVPNSTRRCAGTGRSWARPISGLSASGNVTTKPSAVRGRREQPTTRAPDTSSRSGPLTLASSSCSPSCRTTSPPTCSPR